MQAESVWASHNLCLEIRVETGLNTCLCLASMGRPNISQGNPGTFRKEKSARRQYTYIKNHSASWLRHIGHNASPQSIQYWLAPASNQKTSALTAKLSRLNLALLFTPAEVPSQLVLTAPMQARGLWRKTLWARSKRHLSSVVSTLVMTTSRYQLTKVRYPPVLDRGWLTQAESVGAHIRVAEQWGERESRRKVLVSFSCQFDQLTEQCFCCLIDVTRVGAELTVSLEGAEVVR